MRDDVDDDDDDDDGDGDSAMPIIMANERGDMAPVPASHIREFPAEF